MLAAIKVYRQILRAGYAAQRARQPPCVNDFFSGQEPAAEQFSSELFSWQAEREGQTPASPPLWLQLPLQLPLQFPPEGQLWLFSERSVGRENETSARAAMATAKSSITNIDRFILIPVFKRLTKQRRFHLLLFIALSGMYAKGGKKIFIIREKIVYHGYRG